MVGDSLRAAQVAAEHIRESVLIFTKSREIFMELRKLVPEKLLSRALRQNRLQLAESNQEWRGQQTFDLVIHADAPPSASEYLRRALFSMPFVTDSGSEVWLQAENQL